jgi:hypothetical protein
MGFETVDPSGMRISFPGTFDRGRYVRCLRFDVYDSESMVDTSAGIYGVRSYLIPEACF